MRELVGPELVKYLTSKWSAFRSLGGTEKEIPAVMVPVRTALSITGAATTPEAKRRE